MFPLWIDMELRKIYLVCLKDPSCVNLQQDMDFCKNMNGHERIFSWKMKKTRMRDNDKCDRKCVELYWEIFGKVCLDDPKIMPK